MEKREFRERERVTGSTRESEWRHWWHIGRYASIMDDGASNS
jgi:hypothetical protein